MTTTPRHDDTAPATAPALNPPTWSGRKTAIGAAQAVGISSIGTLAAAAAFPAGAQGGATGGSQLKRAPLRGKDFGAIPVGGSVRPSASQRRRGGQA